MVKLLNEISYSGIKVVLVHMSLAACDILGYRRANASRRKDIHGNSQSSRIGASDMAPLF